ncbi:MAG: hypothetical protein V1799_07350 [bacterium]
MANYSVGFIFTRCFLQKELIIKDNIIVKPLLPSSSLGELHNLKRLLAQTSFNFPNRKFQETIESLKTSGQSVLILFNNIDQKNCITAIEALEEDVEAIAGSLAVVSRNPVIKLCGYAQDSKESCIKFYLPHDDIVKHAINIHSDLDAASDIANRALTDSKYALLLRLYRSSLREPEVDNQILFQLILLEEASDTSSGDSFAKRLRAFCDQNGLHNELNYLVQDLEIIFPSDKDIIDALVKLRNCCAHNGKIDKATLEQYNGEWLYSLLDDKPKLQKLIAGTIRYLFAVLVGHSHEAKATPISLAAGEEFKLKFND